MFLFHFLWGVGSYQTMLRGPESLHGMDKSVREKEAVLLVSVVQGTPSWYSVLVRGAGPQPQVQEKTSSLYTLMLGRL